MASRRIVPLAVLLAISSPAGAEDLERAQELFEKGRALVGENQFKQACPLFEEALELGAGLGTELNLAACWAKIGRLVEAKKLFIAIVAKSSSPELAKYRRAAEGGIADIDERMPKLQIERGGLPSSATVYLDGVELIDTSEPIPVDPGTHTIEAEGAENQTVTAIENQVTEVILVGSETTGGVGPAVPPKTPSWFDGDRRPLYLGGAGAALILTGTITGILTLSKRSDGIALCEGPESALMCGPEGRDTLDTARTLSHVTTAFFVIGTGLVVTGVIWKLQERSKKPDRPQMTGWISGAGGGFALEHVW